MDGIGQKFMDMSFKKIALAALVLAFGTFGVGAQERFGNALEFDRTTCDFGDLLVSDGPVSCEFRMTNVGERPVVIYDITTTCGCTVPKWDKEPVRSGESTTIIVRYSNDEGAIPFDKVLRVHTSAQDTPILLKLRGVVRETEENLETMYPEHFGVLGLRNRELKGGTVEMGEVMSGVVQVANLSDSPLKVEFTGLSAGLSMGVSPNPVPARSTAELSYTIKSLAGVWGWNTYYATPVLEDEECGNALKVNVATQENFNTWTEEQKAQASRPMFKGTTYNMGRVQAGEMVHAHWFMSNLGKSAFHAHKAETDNPKAKCGRVPDVEADESIEITADLDTSGLPSGEVKVTVTITTNSPERPFIHLYIAGWIE